MSEAVEGVLEKQPSGVPFCGQDRYLPRPPILCIKADKKARSAPNPVSDSLIHPRNGTIGSAAVPSVAYQITVLRASRRDPHSATSNLARAEDKDVSTVLGISVGVKEISRRGETSGARERSRTGGLGKNHHTTLEVQDLHSGAVPCVVVPAQGDIDAVSTVSCWQPVPAYLDSAIVSYVRVRPAGPGRLPCALGPAGQADEPANRRRAPPRRRHRQPRRCRRSRRRRAG